jgi:glycosyltransferase involved in cell wall biosynthesis
MTCDWSREKADAYRGLNPDLLHLDDRESEKHYLKHGIREGRQLTAPPLPPDFSAAVYRELNLDLYRMSEVQLKAHFRCHGISEDRPYKEVWRDLMMSEKVYLRTLGNFSLVKHPYLLRDAHIRVEQVFHQLKVKNQLRKTDVAIVLNDAHCTGAPLFGIELACELQRQGFAIMLLLPGPGSTENKVIELGCPFLVYDTDDHMLWHLLSNLKPGLVYFNSCNSAMYRVYTAWHGPRLLHSHEIPDHFIPGSFGVLPDIVVSQRIAKLWQQRQNHLPHVASPFLSEKTLAKISRCLLMSDVGSSDDASNNASDVASDNASNIAKRPTVFMCGDTIERKGIKLFAEAARLCPEIDFLWIGGHKPPPCFERIPNLRHQLHVQDPFPHFLQADRLVLSSSNDPCPYVVLEALALGLPVTLFEEACYVDLADCPGCTVIPGSPSLMSYVEACRTSCVKKDSVKYSGNKDSVKYIQKNFSVIPTVQLCIEVLQGPGKEKVIYDRLLPAESRESSRTAAQSTTISSECSGPPKWVAPQHRD